jgi:hypothetical protein
VRQQSWLGIPTGSSFALAACLLALLSSGCKEDVGTGGDAGAPFPTCPPTAPETHKPDPAGFYTYGALPKGSCNPSTPVCFLPVYGPCGSDPEYVGHPLNIFQCACVSGEWSCSIESAGASVCSNFDGSRD